MIVGPQPDVAVVCSVTLVKLQPRVVLAVAVLSNGAVEKDTVVVDHDVSDDDVAQASTRLSHHVLGSTFAAIGDPPPRPGRADSAHKLVTAVCEGLRRSASTGSEPLFVGGASRLAAEHSAFSNTQVAAHLLEMLEENVVMVALMRELLGPGVTVRIGSEHGATTCATARSCSRRTSSKVSRAVRSECSGRPRMDYRQAQAAVATISRQLSRSLSR